MSDYDDGVSHTSKTNTHSDSLNHRAFKTVQLFKSNALLAIFELSHLSLTSMLASDTQLETLQQELSLMTDILKLQKLQLSQGRNQMQFKLILSEQAI